MKKREKSHSRSSLYSTTGKLTTPSKSQSKSVNIPGNDAVILPGRSIPSVWRHFVRGYESRVHGCIVTHMVWTPWFAREIARISPRRVENRRVGYIDEVEMTRVKQKLGRKGEAAIRFGAEKKGHGYSGERGDFCLVGGAIRGRNLSVFYRSLEMIGGFAYDLTLFDYLENRLGCTFDTVTIHATKAFVFALKGNSNEKLYPKLLKIFQE